MKLNHKFVRTVTTTAAVLGAAAMLSVGAFAAEADINDPAAAGYLPPQEQMVQGDIALHSADVAIGEKDPTYGGYGAPEARETAKVLKDYDEGKISLDTMKSCYPAAYKAYNKEETT